MKTLTHVDADGKIKMVDVSAKKITPRLAMASGKIYMAPETLNMIRQNLHKKGDVLAVAHLGGIQGAKKTAELIQLCHPLPLLAADLQFVLAEDHVQVTASTKVEARTGIEMEALCAVSIACLNIYDMCKAVDRSMRISEIELLRKQGGQSGDYVKP